MVRVFAAKRPRRRGDRKPLLIEGYITDECDGDDSHGSMDIYSGSQQYDASDNSCDNFQLLDKSEHSGRRDGSGRKERQKKKSLQSLPLLVGSTIRDKESHKVDTNGANNTNIKKGKASIPNVLKWKKQTRKQKTGFVSVSGTPSEAGSVTEDKTDVATAETTAKMHSNAAQRNIPSPSTAQQSRVYVRSGDGQMEKSTTAITITTCKTTTKERTGETGATAATSLLEVVPTESTAQRTTSTTKSGAASSSRDKTQWKIATLGRGRRKVQRKENFDVAVAASAATQDCKATDEDSTFTMLTSTEDGGKKKKRVKNKITVTTASKTKSHLRGSANKNNSGCSIGSSDEKDDLVNVDTPIPSHSDEANTENGKRLQSISTTSIGKPSSEEVDDSSNLENGNKPKLTTNHYIPTRNCSEGQTLVEVFGNGAEEAFGDAVNNFVEKMAPINDAILEQSEKLSSKCSSKCSIGILKTDEVKVKWQPTLRVVEELPPTVKLEVNESGTIRYEDESNAGDAFVRGDDESLVDYYEGQGAQADNGPRPTVVESRNKLVIVPKMRSNAHKGAGVDVADSTCEDEDSSSCVEHKNGVECIRVANNVVAFNGGKSPPVLTWRASRETADKNNFKETSDLASKEMKDGEDSAKSKGVSGRPNMQEPKLQQLQPTMISTKAEAAENNSSVKTSSKSCIQAVSEGNCIEVTDEKDEQFLSANARILQASTCREYLNNDDCSVSSSLMIERSIESHLDWIQNSDPPKALDTNIGDNESVTFNNVEIDVNEYIETRHILGNTSGRKVKITKSKLHRGSFTKEECRMDNRSDSGNLTPTPSVTKDSAPPSPVSTLKVLGTAPATPNTQSTTATSPASSINSSSNGVQEDTRAQRQDPKAQYERPPASASNHSFLFIPRVIRGHYRAMTWFICGACNDDFSNVEPVKTKEFHLDKQQFWYTVPAGRAGNVEDDVSTLCNDDGSFATLGSIGMNPVNQRWQ